MKNFSIINYLNRICKEKKYAYWLAFLIPFLAGVFICIGSGVFPFGENCLLHVDMYHQYCPFYAELQDKIKQGGSFMYSWNLGLGSDFPSLYSYYLASPLNILLLIWPSKYLIEFMELSILVKIGLAGLFCFLFLEKRYQLVGKDKNFHKNTLIPAFVFSTAYALCGFSAAYSWDIMWMDSFALMPLIMLGLYRLVKENKVGLYYVALALSIWANYYLSIMICIFTVFYFFLLFFEQKKGKWRALANFTWFSLLAGGTAAAVILPEIAIIRYSASGDISFPETMEWYFNIFAEVSRLSTVTETYTSFDHWPNLYSGAFSILLVVLYLMNRRISIKDKMLRMAMVLFFFVSFANNYLDFIWHGFDFPNQLPARQTFLFSFLILNMGFETFIKRKGIKIWHITVAMVLSIGMLVGSYLVGDKEVTNLLSIFITCLFILVYACLMLIEKMITPKEKMYKSLPKLKVLACVVALTELILNYAVTGLYSTSRTLYVEKNEGYETLLQMAKEDASKDGTIFYRVEDTERKTKNDSSYHGYPSSTIFSSLMNKNVSTFFQRVYMEGGVNFYCYNGATPLISSMLSVKYFLSDLPVENSPLRTMIGQADGYYLYKNEYCLPLGFMMDENVIEDWNMENASRISSINNLAEVLGAKGELLQYREASNVTTQGKTEIVIPESGYYFACNGGIVSDSLNIYNSNAWSRKYSKTSHKYLFDFGYCEKGDLITITNSNQEEISFSLYLLNMDALNKAYETLEKQTFSMTEYTDTKIAGTMEVKEAGRLIFTIPLEEGWSMSVDGENVEPEAFKGAFISVFLEEGEHEIELSYETPFLKVGLLITVVCSLISFTCILLQNRKQKEKK